MKYFFVFVLLLHLQVSVAQKNIAEWKAALATAKHDTTRLRCYGGILETPLHEDTVLVYLKKAEQLGKKYPNHPTNINIFTRYGSIYRNKNMPDSAKYFYDKAFELALRLQNKRNLKFADFYRTYTIKSLANKINHLYQVLNKYEYDNNNTFDKSLQYQIYNYLIHNYLTFGNIAKAKSLLNIAKPYIVTLQDSVKYYNSFTRIIALDAENIYKFGKSQPKLPFSNTFNTIYADLISFTERNNLPNLRVEPLNSYGKILFYEKKYNEAINKAQELLTHAQKYKYSHAMNLGNMLLTESYVELGQYQKALSFLVKTTPNNIIQNYKRLYLFSKIHQGMGDYSKAYNYLLEATKEEEKVKGVNEQLLSAEIESQMELNKKQQEIAAKELENRLKEERLKTEQQERIALELRSELEISTKEKEINLQKNEITTHKTLDKLKEERIKAEKQQKNIVTTLLLLSLVLLAWVVWSYRKQRQLSKILDANNKLISQQATELKDSNLMKDKIFALLSHDLRTPINHLIFALNSTLENQKKALMHELHNVQDVLNNVLYWSSMQVKKITPQKREISLKPLVDAILNDFDFMLHEKQIEAINAIEPNSILFSDENYLKIILRNLISNAIKFTQTHGFIHVSYKTNDNTAAICVRDTGVGIATEKMDQLFQYPDSSLGTKQEVGSGLGLSLCYEISKLLKGDLKIESQVQQGTKVIIELPIREITNEHTLLV